MHYPASSIPLPIHQSTNPPLQHSPTPSLRSSPGLSSGFTHSANGVTGDGSTGYGDTGFSPRTPGSQFTTNSAHLFVYSGTTTPVDNNSLIDAYSDTGGGSYRAYLRRNSTSLSAAGFNNDLGAGTVAASSDFRGPLLGSRTDGTHMFAALP